MTTIVATDEDTPDSIYEKLRKAERAYLDALHARMDFATRVPLVIEMTRTQVRRFEAALSSLPGVTAFQWPICERNPTFMGIPIIVRPDPPPPGVSREQQVTS